MHLFLLFLFLVTTQKKYFELKVRYLHECLVVELFLQVTKKLANHLFAEPFPRDEEFGNGDRPILDEASLNQVLDAFLWFSEGKSTSMKSLIQ